MEFVVNIFVKSGILAVSFLVLTEADVIGSPGIKRSRQSRESAQQQNNLKEKITKKSKIDTTKIISKKAEVLKKICRGLSNELSNVCKKLEAKIDKGLENGEFLKEFRLLYANMMALNKDMCLYEDVFTKPKVNAKTTQNTLRESTVDCALGIVGFGVVVEKLAELEKILNAEEFQEYKIKYLGDYLEQMKNLGDDLDKIAAVDRIISRYR